MLRRGGEVRSMISSSHTSVGLTLDLAGDIGSDHHKGYCGVANRSGCRPAAHDGGKALPNGPLTIELGRRMTSGGGGRRKRTGGRI